MSKAFPGFDDQAPTFDQPFEMLAACHDRIEAQLRILDRLGAHLVSRGADEEAIAAVRRVRRYFDEAEPKHHADEEADLFPMLEAQGKLIQLLQVLREDHRNMQAGYALVRPMLLTVEAGRVDAWKAETVDEFCRLYRVHISCENIHLLPVAATLLPAADQKRLGEAMVARRTR